MLIPILWTAIVSLLTGVAVYYNCQETNEEAAVLFTAFIAVGFSFAAMLICIAAGM